MLSTNKYHIQQLSYEVCPFIQPKTCIGSGRSGAIFWPRVTSERFHRIHADTPQSFVSLFGLESCTISSLHNPKTCIRSTVHCSNLGAWRLEFASRADPGLLAHPPGCFLFFSVIRGCRCAQPPAICCHASGMKNRPFTAKWGGNRELLSSPNW